MNVNVPRQGNRAEYFGMNVRTIAVFALVIMGNVHPATAHDSPAAPARKKAADRTDRVAVREVLAVLDSVWQHGGLSNDSLLLYYSRLVSRIFLPFDTGGGGATTIDLTGVNGANAGVVLDSAERLPRTSSWNVSSSGAAQGELPTFSYSWEFDLREQMKLRFPSVPPVERGLFRIGGPGERFTGEAAGPLVFNPTADPRTMQMVVTIDCGGTQLPLRDYLCTFVCNNFDRIEERKERRLPKAVSLRCYNRSSFRNLPDAFYAFVAFDRYLNTGEQPEKRGAAPASDDFIRVRYIISVKTSGAVEEKAEVLLREVLGKFSLKE